MNAKIIFGVSIVLIIIISVVFLLLKKEHFSNIQTCNNQLGYFLTVDQNGNIGASAGMGLIAFSQYPFQSTWENGENIITLPINANLTPDMIIIAEMTMTVCNITKDLSPTFPVSTTIGDKTQTVYGIIATEGYTNNFKLVFSGLSGSSNTFVANIQKEIFANTDLPPINIYATDSVFIYAITPLH